MTDSISLWQYIDLDFILLVFIFCGLVQSSVIYLVLKYVVDWVDGQVAFLEAKDTAILFSFCVRLLEIYSAHNIGKVPFESLIYCFVYSFEILNSKLGIFSSSISRRVCGWIR